MALWTYAQRAHIALPPDPEGGNTVLMVVIQIAGAALLVLGSLAHAENDFADNAFKSQEAQVNPSEWIKKACSGESVRFSISGQKTDTALKDFGSSMGLSTKYKAPKKVPQRNRGFKMASPDETFGKSPSASYAQASWDYSNTNPKKSASCRSRLRRYSRKYGNRLKFSNTPSGFASFFNPAKPFHKAVATRMKQLGKSKIATNRYSRGTHYDGGKLKNGPTTQSSSGSWLSRFFGSSNSARDKIREAKSKPRAQAPLGQRSLRSRSVPKPPTQTRRKSYGQEIMDWGSRKYKSAKGAFGSAAGAISENVNNIAGFFGTSGSGGRYVRKYTRRIMEAWSGNYNKKIQITSASRKSSSGYRNYSDVHKGHKRGLTLDVGSKGAAENARMLHALYKADAPVSRMLHTNNAAVIKSAGRQYGTNSTYVQWLKRKLVYYKGHSGHIDVKFT